MSPGTARRPHVPDVEARAGRLHRRGVAAKAAGRPAAAASHLRSALALLGWPRDTTYAPQVARILISLAHAEAEQGRTRRGLRLLDEAEPLTAPADRGILQSQRGLLLYRTGRADDALPYFDAAVPLLSGIDLARVLLNRGALHHAAGRVRLAREDLRRCEQLAREAGSELLVAKAIENLGACDREAGDIPAALAAFDAARRAYDAYGAGFRPVLSVDRARALLHAGLATEAGRELDQAIEQFRRQRLSQDLAEAELVRALAALAGGDHQAAHRWATQAERRFHRRGNEAWAALCALTRLRADFELARPPAPLAARAAGLADRLRGLGLGQDAEIAHLLSIRAQLRSGTDPELVKKTAAVESRPARQSVEVRLLRQITNAELATALGRRGEALAHLRAGLGVLQEHRSRFGSVDLKISTAALGVETARAGLAAALDDGSPRLVFGWSERSRAQAFRVPPVRPPADPETVDVLAELRQLHSTVRVAELEGRPVPEARARRAELERRVRERDWHVAGTGESSALATLAEVSAELVHCGQTMVSFLTRHGRLFALVIRGGSARLVGLGDYGRCEEAVARLLGDLNALAGRRLPTRLATVIEASIQQQLSALVDEIGRPLRSAIGEEDLVIVPTRSLSSVPWGMVPGLRGRPVAVVPSASSWLASRRRPRSGGGGSPLLVAGPDLGYAPSEVAAIAAIHPESQVLTAESARVEPVLRALDGASVAHFATHGHHEQENVLFSRLDLVDGPLMAHDIQRLARAPEHVVLSACDVGRTVVRAGDEILGFTAALLYAGTTSVVASVARVPDDTAVGSMVAYHRGLAAGTPPASALATASLAEPLFSFVCFGLP